MNNAIKVFFSKYKAEFLSFLLTLFMIPLSFYYAMDASLDFSWTRALNIAVSRGWVFGRDFIFTYGPLGYLATRNTQYIHNVYLVLFDVYMCAAFYFLFLQFLKQSSRWFLLIVIAVFYFRSVESSLTLFAMFIAYGILCLKHEFKNVKEIIFCVVCGVLAFFVKINYGILVLPVMASFLIAAIPNRRNFLIFLITFLVTFGVICLKVHIDLMYYLIYGIRMISGYDEAMVLEIKPNSPQYISAIIVLILFVALLVVYIIRQLQHKDYRISRFYIPALLSLLVFLLYKNGFTRADGHVDGFFYVMPFYVLLTFFVLYNNYSTIAMLLVILTVGVCDYNLEYEKLPGQKGLIYKATVGKIENYFATFCQKQNDSLHVRLNKIPDHRLALMKDATVDIFPIDIAVLQLNGLNYDPRPIIQSYAVFNKLSDSLNAHHFFKQDRPEFIMSTTWDIDDRYPAWEESLTKAAIRLNYDFAGLMATSGRPDSSFSDGLGFYLLLRSKYLDGKHTVGVYPKFDKLKDTVVRFGDTVYIDFPGDVPIYMSADWDYTSTGKINKLVFQPAITHVTFILDSLKGGERISYRAIRPMLQQPALINKFVSANSNFINFLTGSLKYNRNIRAFCFSANRPADLKKEIRLSFYRFTNY